MFYKWRINRLRRKVRILETQLSNLNALGSSHTYYVDEALRVATKLSGYRYDLNAMEGKAND